MLNVTKKPGCILLTEMLIFFSHFFNKLSINETPKTNQEDETNGTVALTFVGELPEFAPEQHPMKGSVFFNPTNESQIIVRDFYYPQVK